MPYIHLCVNCGKELVCIKDGINVSLAKTTSLDQKVGICRADLWKCRECGFEMLSGFSNSWSPPILLEKIKDEPIYFPKINKWFNKP